ncbi:Arm DNA-binding domain-containing protein [Paenalcaligenes hominis]|uniref:Arm DNA-binding domain-containing protein n=1 Tax=Paenalcaligenes hominis TaxID=643674 RepID=UPI003204A8C4
MARIITPLTDLECRRSKLSDEKSRLFDGGGLYLELLINRSKKWRLKYRSSDMNLLPVLKAEVLRRH